MIPIRKYLAVIEETEKNYNEGKYDIDACTLGEPDLKITEVLSSAEKKSTSDSIICFGRIDRQPVAIKITFPEIGKDANNPLEIERKVYAYIIPKMLQFTPHLTRLDKFITCARWNNGNPLAPHVFARNTIPDRLKRETEVIKSLGFHNTNKATMIITERSPGTKTLWTFITKLGINYDFWQAVIFQIAYTLMVFELFGLRHNDLHANNIFVDEVKEPIEIIYQIKGRKYKLLTKHFVRIYDFDLAGKSKTQLSPLEFNNKLLTSEFCPQYGQCNNFVANWDWITILTYIYIGRYDPKTKISANNWVEDIMPRKYLLQQVASNQNNLDRTDYIAFLGRSCTCVDSTCSKCQIRIDMLKDTKTPYETITDLGFGDDFLIHTNEKPDYVFP